MFAICNGTSIVPLSTHILPDENYESLPGKNSPYQQFQRNLDRVHGIINIQPI